MELKNQVVSLVPSQEMAKEGATQDSIWYWTWAEWNEETEWVLIAQARIAKLKREHFSAHTVAEMGEMLKPYAEALPVWNKYKMGAEWFSDIYSVKGYCQINERKEADARAKVWLYLKREGLI